MPSCSASISASLHLANQTTPIASTVLFTASQAGQYRLTFSASAPAGAGSDSVSTSISWVDDAGNSKAVGLPSLIVPGSDNGTVFALTIAASATLSFDTVYGSGNPTGPTYNLFLTLEQLA